ncbi:hypothetical protein ACT1U9_33000 (plasmid) [Streptomyces sp. BR1]|uniref:hypothetical protein n=1 Tax=Streptomyces sp. BR1 TaxID=1592323 RepID=UPI00402BC1A4
MSYESAPETPRTEATVQPYYPAAQQAAPLYRMPIAFQAADVELYAERDPVVWVPDAYGQMVPMRKSQAPAPMQPMAPRDLTPQPLFDPKAQRIAAGGVLGAGVGWGAGQAVSAVAGLGVGTAAFIFFSLLLLRLGGAAVGRTTIRNTTNVTNNNRGFGRSNTTVNH